MKFAMLTKELEARDNVMSACGEVVMDVRCVVGAIRRQM